CGGFGCPRSVGRSSRLGAEARRGAAFDTDASLQLDGIYFGMNGGGGWGRQDPLNLISNRFDGKSIDFSGGLFGGTAGARIQSGQVVIGLEADIDWANMKGSA